MSSPTSPADDLHAVPALLPCPWCGEMPDSERHDDEGDVAWAVACLNERGCAAQPCIWGESESNAVDDWNTRIPASRAGEPSDRASVAGARAAYNEWQRVHGNPGTFDDLDEVDRTEQWEAFAVGLRAAYAVDGLAAGGERKPTADELLGRELATRPIVDPDLAHHELTQEQYDALVRDAMKWRSSRAPTGLEQLAEKWDQPVGTLWPADDQVAATYRVCARELRAALGREEGRDG